MRRILTSFGIGLLLFTTVPSSAGHAEEATAAQRKDLRRLQKKIADAKEERDVLLAKARALGYELGDKSPAEQKSLGERLSLEIESERKEKAMLTACVAKLQEIGKPGLPKKQVTDAVEAMRNGTEADRACVRLLDAPAVNEPK